MFEEACKSVNIAFDADKYKKFMIYKELIKEWNKKINLTSITDDEEMIKKHFIDSIKVFQFLPLKCADKIIDVGTGAGFPGIPIKILCPQIHIVLLDSLNKRINFLNEVIDRLKLDDIKPVHGRAEDYGQNIDYREKFDIAVSRAVAELNVLSEYCIPFIKKGGYFIALKGPSAKQEIDRSNKSIKVLGGMLDSVIEVNIENTDLKHNLVIIKKEMSTPSYYPRKAGTASKNPIL